MQNLHVLDRPLFRERSLKSKVLWDATRLKEESCCFQDKKQFFKFLKIIIMVILFFVE